MERSERYKMRENKEKKCLGLAMLCGILGCLCYGSGDWLMMYGNPEHTGDIFWLTEGVAQIPSWRNNLSMLVAFPGIVFYGIALFYLGTMIKDEKEKKIYHYLNAFGLTPWMCLHIFYVMILYLYAWLCGNGYGDIAYQICEAVYLHLSWIVILCEVFMIPVFVYWFYVVLRGKTKLPKWVAFTNVLIIFAVMEVIKSFMPESAFRIGFTNGLMSESMFIFFIIILVVRWKQINYITPFS
jgi:hypothetical protein